RGPQHTRAVPGGAAAGESGVEGRVSRVSAFACVGGLGFAVQIAVVAALTGLAGWHGAAATAAGVEAAVLHNFVWHCRWTWRDRADVGGGTAARLLRFHLANGLTSIAGNVIISIVLMRAGVGAVVANTVAVA